MSWFTELAGKAEDILNKIDQNAANVLKDKSIITEQLTDVIWHNSDRRSSVEEEPVVSRSSSPATFSSSTPLKPAKPVKPVRSNAPSPAPRASPSRMGNLQRKDEDEEFFRFLNGSDVLHQPSESDEMRRSPSGISVASAGSFSAVGGQDSQTESRTNSPSLGSSAVIHSKDDAEAVAVAVASAQSVPVANFTEQATRQGAAVVANRAPSTNLFDENEMLKKEIRTLNSEVSLLLKRAKAAEEELISYSKKRASDDNLVSQLKTLQNSLRAAQVELAETRDENARLQQAVGKESNTHSDEEVLALKDRIERLIGERDSQSEANHELALRVTRLQETITESASQCERLRQQLASALAETEQYRARATRILQEKEQIISSLQSKVQGQDDSLGSDSAPNAENVWEKQAEQLRRERALDREEIAQLTDSIRALREELQDSERRLEELREKGSKEVDRLQNRLATERARRQAAEEDSKKYAEEVRTARSETSRERQSLNARLRERDIELAKLRSPVSPMRNGSASSASSTPAELEGRVRQLATTLVQKQGALEAVLAERNALRLQLERAERHTSQQRGGPDPPTAVFVNGEDTGVRSRVPTLLVESPSDTGVTRRVKRAYSSVDTLGIRLGVFLRRYPLVRISVIIYVVVCHLWVLLVLFTYTQETQTASLRNSEVAPIPKEPQV